MKALEAELMRRAESVLRGDGQKSDIGPIAATILKVAARIGEEVTRRLDQTPAKQADNFYSAAGIGRDPARPATLPVAIKLAEGAEALVAPIATQLMVPADGPTVFETDCQIDLVPGTVAQLRGLNASEDAISMPSAAVIAAELPRGVAPLRRLRSGSAAGATKVQVDPAAGLKPNMLLMVGDGQSAREHRAVEIEGDLVTIDPPLETDVAKDSPVQEVVEFAPFATTTRNHQSHALYLGHGSLLDLPSPATILISGLPLPAEAQWSWWGAMEEGSEPDWHPLGSGDRLEKSSGKLVTKEIGGKESLWLRAALPGKSTGAVTARDARIAIGGELCARSRDDHRCALIDALTVGWTAIATNTPVVPNQPFYPFGREPRLYDTFYLGSDEAFAKVGAEVSICIDVAGADFGPLAGTLGRGLRLFGAGTDGFLYRIHADPNLDPHIERLPPPRNDLGTVFLRPRSSLACWSEGSNHYVAAIAADGGAVYVAPLLDSPGKPAPDWRRLPLPPGKTIDKLAIASSGAAHTLYGLDGGEVHVWTQTNEGSQPSSSLADVAHLVPIERADSVLIVVDDGSASLQVIVGGPEGPGQPVEVPRADLPALELSALHDDRIPPRTYIAGYDSPGGKFRLRLVEADDLGQPGLNLVQFDSGEQLDHALPVALSPGSELAAAPGHFPPLLTVATPHPMHIVWVEGTGGTLRPAVSYEPVSIGSSNNPARKLNRIGNAVVVQRPNVGIFLRSSNDDPLVEELSIPASPAVIVAGAPDFASVDRIVYFDADNAGVRLKPVGAPAEDGRQVVEAEDAKDPLPSQADQIIAMRLEAQANPVGFGAPGAITLANTADPTGQRLKIDAEFTSGHQTQIWRLERQSAANDEWPDPGLDPASAWTYRELREVDGGNIITGQHAVLLAPNSDVLHALEDGKQVWRTGNRDLAAIAPVHHGAGAAVAYPESAINQDRALFMAAPSGWISVGPGQAANPALSWEYWNGESWWALAKDAEDPEGPDDRTANLTISGGVFFKVPADIAATEVGGRKMHWIRLRLVGGDYGEAVVKEVAQGVFQRDTSTIAAPNIVGLRLGYCAIDPVRPEVVITADNLGVIDQTSANEAGLGFPVFTSLAELVERPVPVVSAATADEDCDDTCPDPAEDGASPCDAPGAYESCDSPCPAPAGYRWTAATGGAGSQGFVRGLMIGFDEPFSGNAISLYVAADPSGPPEELVAEVLRNGRFEPVNVLQDGSSGLTEPGILTVFMPNPPDMSNLFGAVAHWLRLKPKRNPSGWSPRIWGIYLNGVLSRSVETRSMERLGASTAVENQEFRLSERPILSGSLELRVQEPLNDEDKQALNIATLPFDRPGDWVLWTAEDDLIEDGEARRVFSFDAEQGVILFGDGRTGRIPPLGADIVAVRYARVVGAKANGVSPGTAIPLLSALAGVDRVQALDYSAGGSDVEPLPSARRRAPAKLRHGGRILTRSDVEDYALTLAPGIAQVRLSSRNGRQRLIVVMKGAQPQPLPAQLRGFAAAIREVAGFGLARDGGLDVVPPRLLPLSVRVVFQPRKAAEFGEAATKAGDCLLALLDPATGNHDGGGWPIGRLPEPQDMAAALSPIELIASLEEVSIRRADRDDPAERALPQSIPDDVLVRLDRSDIAFERAAEAVP